LNEMTCYGRIDRLCTYLAVDKGLMPPQFHQLRGVAINTLNDSILDRFGRLRLRSNRTDTLIQYSTFIGARRDEIDQFKLKRIIRAVRCHVSRLMDENPGWFYMPTKPIDWGEYPYA
jgi:hypothetical protein